MNLKIYEIMIFCICALQEYSDVMSWAYLLASIFYLCAFVGLLHKFEYSFNAWIWNILSSLMPSRQNQFIYRRIRKSIFYLCAFICLLYKFEHPCLCCSILCFSLVWPLSSGSIMNEWFPTPSALLLTTPCNLFPW